MDSEELQERIDSLPEERRFAVGEHAIVVGPHINGCPCVPIGTEVVIVEPTLLRSIAMTLSGAEYLAYAFSHDCTVFAVHAALRRRKLKQRRQETTTWDQCVWRPQEVEA